MKVIETKVNHRIVSVIARLTGFSGLVKYKTRTNIFRNGIKIWTGKRRSEIGVNK